MLVPDHRAQPSSVLRVMSWRIAVDIGGTFTDLVAISQPDGAVVRAKSLTTPARLVDGVLNAIERAELHLDQASDVVHGSTVAINAILQQRGSRTALLTTRGFRDVLEMGRKNRPDMFNLFFRPRQCLVPRELRLEVDERVAFDGQVLQPIDTEALRAIVDSLPADIESIAICLLHSYAHPEHELEVARVAKQQRPHVYVTTSTAVSGEFREYERTSTAVANAYVGPLVSHYLGDLGDSLAKEGFAGPLLITQSNGGVMAAEQAMLQPIRTTESGPAAGVNGAAWLGRELGIANLIAFDMGGTTAKACVVIDGVPEAASEYYIGGRLTGIPVQAPFLEIVEVGAGGGSIGHIDDGGGLRVGPISAGSDPGPACYGFGGTEPTVTDANVLVGKIGSDFHGSQLTLHRDRALEAITGVAQRLGIEPLDCANSIIRVANSIMANAIRAVTIERGRDPRDFILVAYGGAGPLHAASLAEELQISQVLVPAGSGTFAASGMQVTDLRHDVGRTFVGEVEGLDAAIVEAAFAELEASAQRFMDAHDDIPAESGVQVVRRLDLRYVGQFHPLTLELPPGSFADVRSRIGGLFHEAHEQRYGHSAEDEPIEVSALRITATRAVPKTAPAPAPRTERELAPREVLFDSGETHTASVHDGPGLEPGKTIVGPAIIEEETTYIVVPPKARATVLPGGHKLIELDGGWES
jgi:N-methylhydantoinase A